MSNYKEAERICQDEMNAVPRTPEIWFIWAEIAAHQKNWMEADRRWENIREKFPKASAPYQCGGWSALQNRDPQRAEAIALAGMELHKHVPGMYALYAEAAMSREDWHEAMRRWDNLFSSFPATDEWLERAIEAARNSGEAEQEAQYMMRYAENAFSHNKPDEATKRWRIWLNKFTGDEATYLRACTDALDAEFFAFANELFDEASSRFPSGPDLKIAALLANYGLQNWQKTEHLGQELLPAFPERTDIAGITAIGLMQCGKIEEAEAILGRYSAKTASGTWIAQARAAL